MVARTVFKEEWASRANAAYVTFALRLPESKDRERLARDIEEYNRVLAVNAGLN